MGNLQLGKALRLCRTQRDLKQSELAERAGICVSYLSLLERDKRDPNLATIQRLADALQVPLTVLIFLAVDQESIGLSRPLVDALSALALRLLREPPEIEEG